MYLRLTRRALWLICFLCCVNIIRHALPLWAMFYLRYHYVVMPPWVWDSLWEIGQYASIGIAAALSIWWLKK